MLIFLDSNIICADYKMKSPSFEVAQKVGTIVLGQIVVDEVCNKYRENLEEKATKTRKAILELNDPLLTPHIVWRELDISDECSKYKDFLEMFIIESGMTVAEPYPKDGHELIVQRALQRKKPFKADGSTGYRDYLVWLTCLEVARSYSSEEIHFISGNTRDFADANDKEKLHPDMLADLAEMNIPETRFFYWNSFRSFIDNYAKQKLESIEERENLAAEIEKNETGFLVPIRDFLGSKVIGGSLIGYDVFVPGENAILKELESDAGPLIEEVSELDEDSWLIGITIDNVGIVTSTLNDSDIEDIKEYELDVEIVDRNNGICNLETTVGIQLKLQAVYSKSKQSITSIEIDDINDYNCPYCPY